MHTAPNVWEINGAVWRFCLWGSNPGVRIDWWFFCHFPTVACIKREGLPVDVESQIRSPRTKSPDFVIIVMSCEGT